MGMSWLNGMHVQMIRYGFGDEREGEDRKALTQGYALMKNEE
jgi:hypothetical protein